MAPKEFHVDYEAATIKAIKDEFPDSSILGCSVHFKRCIKKHLQTKGLLQLYNTDPEVKLLSDMSGPSLWFLPAKLLRFGRTLFYRIS